MWIACGSDDNTVGPDKPNQDDPDPDNPIEVVDISAEDLVDIGNVSLKNG